MDKQFPSYCGWKLGQILCGLVFFGPPFTSYNHIVLQLYIFGLPSLIFQKSKSQKKRKVFMSPSTRPSLVSWHQLQNCHIITSFVGSSSSIGNSPHTSSLPSAAVTQKCSSSDIYCYKQRGNSEKTLSCSFQRQSLK